MAETTSQLSCRRRSSAKWYMPLPISGATALCKFPHRYRSCALLMTNQSCSYTSDSYADLEKHYDGDCKFFLASSGDLETRFPWLEMSHRIVIFGTAMIISLLLNIVS